MECFYGYLTSWCLIVFGVCKLFQWGKLGHLRWPLGRTVIFFYLLTYIQEKRCFYVSQLLISQCIK